MAIRRFKPLGADGSGGSQTPWTGDVDAAGYDLTNLEELTLKQAGDDYTVTFNLTSGWMEINQAGADANVFGTGIYAKGVSEIGIYDTGQATVSSPPVSTDIYAAYNTIYTENDDVLAYWGFWDGDRADFQIGCNVRGGKLQFEALNDAGSGFTMIEADAQAQTVALRNFVFDVDQTVGASQDDYVLTYDDSAGTIGLEAAPSGGFAAYPAHFVDSGSHNVTVSATTPGLDTETDPDGGYTYNSPNIEVLNAGWYHISYNCLLNDDSNSGAARSQAKAWLERDQGTGTWLKLNQLQGGEYVRESNNGSGISFSGLVELAANEEIRVQILSSNGTDISTEADGQSLSIFRVSE